MTIFTRKQLSDLVFMGVLTVQEAEGTWECQEWQSPNNVTHTIVRGRCATCGKHHE